MSSPAVGVSLAALVLLTPLLPRSAQAQPAVPRVLELAFVDASADGEALGDAAQRIRTSLVRAASAAEHDVLWAPLIFVAPDVTPRELGAAAHGDARALTELRRAARSAPPTLDGFVIVERQNDELVVTVLSRQGSKRAGARVANAPLDTAALERIATSIVRALGARSQRFGARGGRSEEDLQVPDVFR